MMDEKKLLGLIDALQTVVSVQGEQLIDLQHNLSITTLELQNVRKKVALLEPYVYESSCKAEDFE